MNIESIIIVYHRYCQCVNQHKIYIENDGNDENIINMLKNHIKVSLNMLKKYMKKDKNKNRVIRFKNIIKNNII